MAFVACIALVVAATFVQAQFSEATRPQERREYYCTECKMEVQASTKHCNTCGICVDHFDHHCVWLNLCVGRGNYGLFITVVVVGFAALIYSFVYSMAVCLPRVDYWNSKSWASSVQFV